MGLLLGLKMFGQTRKLDSPNEHTRRDAINFLTTIGKPAKRALLAATMNSNWYVRRESISSLAKLGYLTTEIKVSSLIEDLKDKSGKNESGSVVAIGTESLSKVGIDAQKAIPELTNNLRHWHPAVRYYSAFAIVNIAPKRQPFITKAMKALSGSIKLNCWLDGYSIKMLPASLQVVPELIQALDKAAVGHYSLIIETLGRIAMEFKADETVKNRIIPILNRELQNKDNYICQLARDYLDGLIP